MKESVCVNVKESVCVNEWAPEKKKGREGYGRMCGKKKTALVLGPTLFST